MNNDYIVNLGVVFENLPCVVSGIMVLVTLPDSSVD